MHNYNWIDCEIYSFLLFLIHPEIVQELKAELNDLDPAVANEIMEKAGVTAEDMRSGSTDASFHEQDTVPASIPMMAPIVEPPTGYIPPTCPIDLDSDVEVACEEPSLQCLGTANVDQRIPTSMPAETTPKAMAAFIKLWYKLSFRCSLCFFRVLVFYNGS